MTALHSIARSGDLDSIKDIIHLLPESQRLQAGSALDRNGSTMLHYAARLGKLDSVNNIIAG